ncbi:excisionase family DNA-binding protein [Micromonospora sp. DT62]|uniref:excisionase family DNA-binding protein n=1 Tax=Micromonospora sp. DT62 TaxID=3416521 RepID=UPI003CF01EB6
MADKVLLSPEEAAQRLGCGRSFMFELIRTKKIESIKVGRLRRIPVAAVDTYVAELRADQAQAVA